MHLTDIPTIYINLKKREDRNTSVLNELKKINIFNPERFNAIELTNGAVGCSLSHIKCLEIGIERNYEYIMICEDDIEIINPELFTTNTNSFLNSNIEWDMALIAGNNMLPYRPVNNYCIQIFNCLTTTGYIVKKHYFQTLLNNYKEGVKLLMKEQNKSNYKIDKYWQILQNKDNWFLIIPPSIVQKEDYSDIEKKVTDFRNYMLDINKVVRTF
jgi:GR25 family glycosyltransferase involved in LPS biosynthesis